MGASIASALAQRSGSGHRQSWRPAPAEELSGWTGNPLCRQRMRPAFGFFPSRGHTGQVQVTRDSHFSSNTHTKNSGAKRARTADLLHVMGNADVQYGQMLARDDP